MSDPVPSSAIYDATTGGRSVIVITGGSTGDVLTLQSDGTYAPAAPAGGGVGGGTGAVDNAVLRADGVGGSTLQSSSWIINDNLTASPNNTVNHACLEATGGTTNVSVSVKPKGSGSFSLSAPDGAATGGNVRGAYAVDLQTNRSTAADVASGGSSTVSGGAGNRATGTVATVIGGQMNVASGQESIAGGSASTASALYSVALGRSVTASAQSAHARGESTAASAAYSEASGFLSTASAIGASASGITALANRYGQRAVAAGRFAATGDAQYTRFVLRRKTTDATPATLFLDGTSVRLTIPSGAILFASVLISGIKSDGSSAACYKRKVAIKNVGGATSLVGSVETIGTDIEDNASTDVAITADNTNDALDISVTGIAAETWRWVAVVEGLEIAYGT